MNAIFKIYTHGKRIFILNRLFLNASLLINPMYDVGRHVHTGLPKNDETVKTTENS